MPQATAENPNADARRKWRQKTGNALFCLKITIDEENFLQIGEVDKSKKAWDILSSLHSRSNKARIQFLENKIAGLK